MSGCNNGTVIPTNNTPLNCEDYTSSDCIIFETAITYLGMPADSTATQVINALLLSLIDVRDRVNQLENI